MTRDGFKISVRVMGLSISVRIKGLSISVCIRGSNKKENEIPSASVIPVSLFTFVLTLVVTIPR